MFGKANSGDARFAREAKPSMKEKIEKMQAGLRRSLELLGSTLSSKKLSAEERWALVEQWDELIKFLDDNVAVPAVGAAVIGATTTVAASAIPGAQVAVPYAATVAGAGIGGVLAGLLARAGHLIADKRWDKAEDEERARKARYDETKYDAI